MEADVRRKLDMGDRVHVFSVAHPSDDPSCVAVLALFDANRQRVVELEEQERAGRVTAQAATKRRKDLRRSVHSDLLTHLARVGVVAGRENPEVAGRFKLALSNTSYQAFFASARGKLAEAQASKEVLAKAGLAAGILAELTKQVDELGRVTDAGRAAHLAHVGARAELRVTAREQVELVGVLDGLYRFRFRDNPEVLAEWESARNIVQPAAKVVDEPVRNPEAGLDPGNGAVPAVK
ncbi:MAG: hypothetical protein ABI647_20920 [Gemmatimonadota bacterium]